MKQVYTDGILRNGYSESELVNFLNEEVEQFTSRWSHNFVNVRSSSYLKQKIFEYCL